MGSARFVRTLEMRKVLDLVSPYPLQDLFPYYFKKLQALNSLSHYTYQNHLVVAIDGVRHFQSQKVHCESCIHKTNLDGSSTYSHSMLCAMLVHPEEKEVFVLGTEPMVCQDGVEKNDSERAASKRLLDFLAVHYANQPLLLTEDALYATAPNVKQILENNWSFVLAIKPEGNKSLFQAGEQSAHFQCFSYQQDGIHHLFRYANNLPLNASHPSLKVNVLHYTQKDKKGKVTRFSWVSNLAINRQSVYSIMRMGRSRWKIENETFNTLKNQGYHFEHNYGHGRKNLSTVLAYLMLLAFQIDQLIQRLYKPFKRLIKATKTKVKFWSTQTALIMTQVFSSFLDLYLNIARLFKVHLE